MARRRVDRRRPAHGEPRDVHGDHASAVQEAFQQPRTIDFDLVDAQQARRILDRLVGFELSPLLQKGLKRWTLSAGRVQSVALRLIVDREREIEAFVAQEYWSVDARLSPERRRPRVPGAADPGGRGEARRVAGQEAAWSCRRRRRPSATFRRSGTRRTACRRSASARSSARRRRRSPPRRSSRRPRGSSGSRRARPCRSPSACTRA